MRLLRPFLLRIVRAVRFLCDAQRLVHEAVWQQVELILGDGEYEVVAVVAAEWQRAGVFAERLNFSQAKCPISGSPVARCRNWVVRKYFVINIL